MILNPVGSNMNEEALALDPWRADAFLGRPRHPPDGHL